MSKKKIISFSLWGANPGYCIGAVRNALKAPDIYPGWTCRFYCDPIVPETTVKELLELGSEIVYKPESPDFEGLYWRFEPMFDDGSAERFIVRDTDSLVNVREADAVKQWEEDGRAFHFMRDNPAHNIPVMGGMWGSVCGAVPDFSLLMHYWINECKGDLRNPRGRLHGTDQQFLQNLIWPFAEKNHVAHISSENCRFTPYDLPFRIKLNRDGYVGMIYTREDADRCELEVQS